MRQYSLTGDASEGAYRVAVLREDAGRGGSLAVHDGVAVGDRLRIRGPRNHFAPQPAPFSLFLAGGIGITPLLPMAAEAERRRPPLAVALPRAVTRNDGLRRRAPGPVRRQRLPVAQCVSAVATTSTTCGGVSPPADASTPAVRRSSSWPSKSRRAERAVRTAWWSSGSHPVRCRRSRIDRSTSNSAAAGPPCAWPPESPPWTQSTAREPTCCPRAARAPAARARCACWRASRNIATPCSGWRNGWRETR